MQKEIDQLSTDKILASTVQMIVEKHSYFPAEHLDIGSGTGSLIKLLTAHLEIHSQACDYTDSLMNSDAIKVSIVNLNYEKHIFLSDHKIRSRSSNLIANPEKILSSIGFHPDGDVQSLVSRICSKMSLGAK